MNTVTQITRRRVTVYITNKYCSLQSRHLNITDRREYHLLGSLKVQCEWSAAVNLLQAKP